MAIEAKFSSSPKPARGFHEAMVDLKASGGFVIAPVREAFDLSAQVRVFSFITMNWRGRPLISHEVIVSLIASTKHAAACPFAPNSTAPSTPKARSSPMKRLQPSRSSEMSFMGIGTTAFALA